MEIVALSHSLSGAKSYIVVLGEVSGVRKLPIIIGSTEAQAIAVVLEKMKPSRPLTHDLFKNFAATFNIEMAEVIINNLQKGVFYSVLVCINDKKTIEIDSRTSDAIALAIRFGCPIYTYEHVLQNASMMMGDNSGSAKKSESSMNVPIKNETPKSAFGALSRMSLDELQHMLSIVLEQEDYVKAAAIRDEINSRKK